MELVKHETCLEYFRRRLSEGWMCINLEGHNAVLLSPDGIRRELDLRNDVETLRPNGQGTTTTLPYTDPAKDPADHWQNVDEAEADDDISVVGIAAIDDEYDTYALPDSGVGAGTINKVTVFMRYYNFSFKGAEGRSRTVIRTGATDYFGTEQTVLLAWTDSSTEYAQNPGNVHAWTWEEIDALEAGYRASGDSAAKCTQVYVEVDYTPVEAVGRSRGFIIG